MIIRKNNIDDVFKSKKRAIEARESAGLKYLENLFVDSSGFGREGEPALTIRAFKARINELVDQYGSIQTFITSAGQFQVNLGVYIKNK